MTKETKKVNRKLPAGVNYLRDISNEAYQIFYGIVKDTNTTIEDVLKPGYFGNHAARFLVGGNNGFPLIQLDWEDGTKSVELKVLAIGNQTAKCFLKENYDFTKEAAKLESEVESGEGEAYMVAYKGPTKKFCIIRTCDKEIIKEGFLKEDAYTELKEYSKTISD